MMFNEDFWIRHYDKKFKNDFGEEFQPGWYFYTYDYREIGPFHSKEDTLTAMRDYSESEGDIDYSEEINGKKKNKIEDFITVNKNDLLNALKKIKPGISTKDLIQEYACVYLSDKDVSSFSERMIVSYPFEFPKPLNCLVDYTILVSILDKINSVEVNLSLTENELIIFTDSIKSGIALIEGSHPPIDLPYDWFEFPEDFMSGLEFCSFSVSKDMTIPSVTCIHINRNIILSTDTKRVTQYEMVSPSPFDFHIPYIVFKNLKGYNFKLMGQTDNLIHFIEDDGAIFSFYQMDLDRKITPQEAEKYFNVEGTEIEFPIGFKNVIDRASVMTEGIIEMDFLVEISLEKNKFEVSSRKENGWFTEEGDIEYDGELVKFKTSAPFLLEILGRTNKATIGNMCLFKGGNFMHVMVLVD